MSTYRIRPKWKAFSPDPNIESETTMPTAIDVTPNKRPFGKGKEQTPICSNRFRISLNKGGSFLSRQNLSGRRMWTKQLGAPCEGDQAPRSNSKPDSHDGSDTTKRVRRSRDRLPIILTDSNYLHVRIGRQLRSTQSLDRALRLFRL